MHGSRRSMRLCEHVIHSQLNQDQSGAGAWHTFSACVACRHAAELRRHKLLFFLLRLPVGIAAVICGLKSESVGGPLGALSAGTSAGSA